MIVAFVDEHRGEFGVEFICRHLQVAPSTYYAAKRREAEPSARAKRDAALMPILLALWVATRKVYGAHKLWKAARRAATNSSPSSGSVVTNTSLAPAVVQAAAMISTSAAHAAPGASDWAMSIAPAERSSPIDR